MKNKYIFELSRVNNQDRYYANLDTIDFSIIEDQYDDFPSVYFFTSIHLNNLTKAEEIWARGLAINSLYTGAYNLCIDPTLEYATFSRLEFTRLRSLEPDSDITPINAYHIVQSTPFDPTLFSLPLDPYQKPESHKINHAIYKARTNNDIKNLLLQLGNGLDWVNLYSILDSLKTYSKTDSNNKPLIKKDRLKLWGNILKDAGYNENDVSAFTGTANNFGLLGIQARHGDLNYDKPTKIKTLEESQKLLIDLCNSFLKLKHSIR